MGFHLPQCWIDSCHGLHRRGAEQQRHSVGWDRHDHSLGGLLAARPCLDGEEGI